MNPMIELKIVQNLMGDIDYIETSLTGEELLLNPKLNKGCAFTREERELFGLNGLLPYQIETLEQQVERMHAQFHEQHTNLGKHIYLNVLHDYNETLFYKLVSQHLEEMLPIIYTPTVGEAVQKYSLELRKPGGLYINFCDRENLGTVLNEHLSYDTELCVVTDGEAVLGIGDQGIGGINISRAKQMVYTLCGGFNPNRILPIQLDVGTNNPHLLNDPMYLGWRHERIVGPAYDDFIDEFVQAITKKFPHICIHWEDFGRENARRILSRYQDSLCTFNGDKQGTGVIALACVLAGIFASGKSLHHHRIAILGAGTAGIGIADEIYEALCRLGLSNSDAREKLWLIDKNGLLIKHGKLLSFQTPYARNPEDVNDWQLRNPDEITLYDVVKNAKPTVLIGCSTASGAFSEEIVRMMTSYIERPIIMPLSNPPSLAEAKPEDLIKWTHAKAIIATGSPFPSILHEGKWHRIAQSNNAFAYPGIGLGAVAAKSKQISKDMLWAATQALESCSPIKQDKMSPLLPKLSEAKMVSEMVATAVAIQARKEGLAQIPEYIDLKERVKSLIWTPQYYRYHKRG